MKTLTLLTLFAFLLSACDFTQSGPSGVATPGQATPPSSGEQATGLPGTSPPLVRGCLAGDFKAVAGYQGATGSMSGGVILINVSATPCTVQGRPGIHLTDAKGNLLPVANLQFNRDATANGTPTTAPNSAGPLLLESGATAFVFFVWSNWCGQAEGPFTLAVALPGEGGQLNVPAQDPEGKPLTSAPRCDQSDATSTISIGSFERQP